MLRCPGGALSSSGAAAMPAVVDGIVTSRLVPHYTRVNLVNITTSIITIFGLFNPFSKYSFYSLRRFIYFTILISEANLVRVVSCKKGFI